MCEPFRAGRLSHYGPTRAEWWQWLPYIKWHRQGAAWCLDMQWLCFFMSTYWEDAPPQAEGGRDGGD
jgi:hypothetical protein